MTANSQALLLESERSNEVYAEGRLERVFIFCLMWSFAALVDDADRAKVDVKLREC